MYKKMSKQGAMFISVPSAFTETTGKNTGIRFKKPEQSKIFLTFLPQGKQVNIAMEEKLMDIL